jgi:putative ABC transport system permease protein
VHSFHITLALLTLAIGVLAAGEIITLSYLERRIHLAVLRAVGWSRARILALLTAQALVLGLLGGVAGAILVGVTGMLLGATMSSILFAAAIGLLVALAVTILAVAGPLLLAYLAQPAEILRGE